MRASITKKGIDKHAVNLHRGVDISTLHRVRLVAATSLLSSCATFLSAKTEVLRRVYVHQRLLCTACSLATCTPRHGRVYVSIYVHQRLLYPSLTSGMHFASHHHFHPTPSTIELLSTGPPSGVGPMKLLAPVTETFDMLTPDSRPSECGAVFMR